VVQLFADDLNVSTSCATEVSNDVLIGDLRDAQQRAHAWGHEHRVSFDPTKEHINVLHPQFGDDSTFNLLGTLIDCRLTMDPCIDSVISKMPKIKALLRTRSTYSVSSMLNQYRAHIWPSVEYSNGVLSLGVPSHLHRLDAIQEQYLHQLGIVGPQTVKPPESDHFVV